MNNFGQDKEIGKHIINADKFSQPVLFDGIGKGQMRPTDYDAVFEIDNKYWLAFEVKEVGKKMPYGQSLSYTRTADKWNQCGDVGIVFVVEHGEYDSAQPIMLKDCKVKKMYHKGEWRNTTREEPYTVLQMLSALAEKYNISKLKNIG